MNHSIESQQLLSRRRWGRLLSEMALSVIQLDKTHMTRKADDVAESITAGLDTIDHC